MIMPLKRSRSTSSFRSRAKRARRTGSMLKGQIGLGRRVMTRIKTIRLASRVNNLYKMIETKELSHKTAGNVALQHNNTLSLQRSDGLALNIFYSGVGADDPMTQNTGSRIGDQITVKGVMIRGFFENAINRTKVFYRVMLIRGAKGETFSRANIFKGDSDNKMIDQVNTERFSVLAQKVFTISCANALAIFLIYHPPAFVNKQVLVLLQVCKNLASELFICLYYRF